MLLYLVKCRKSRDFVLAVPVFLYICRNTPRDSTAWTGSQKHTKTYRKVLFENRYRDYF